MGRSSSRNGTSRPSLPARPSWPALSWLALLVLAVSASLLLAVHSDAANTDVRTAAEPPEPPDRAVAERLAPLWSSDDEVDDQRAVAGNTVIVSTARGVRGLDRLTGAERWHYLRSNATMCDLAVLTDVVVAIFRTTGRCNEAVALEAGTGARRWYRNFDFASRLSLLGSGTAVLASSPGGIAVLDAVGNSIRWRYNPPRGCELSSVGIGTSGAVIVEDCTTGTSWLALFELYSGQQKWRVPPPADSVSVLGADGVVGLLAGQQALVLRAQDGVLMSTLGTPADPAATNVTGQTSAGGIPLIYVAGRLYAIDPASGRPVWAVSATGLPAASDFGVLVPEEAGAFVVRNPVTGQEIARSVVVAAAVAGTDGLTRVERAGSVLIAVTKDGVTAYG